MAYIPYLSPNKYLISFIGEKILKRAKGGLEHALARAKKKKKKGLDDVILDSYLVYPRAAMPFFEFLLIDYSYFPFKSVIYLM